MSRGSRLPSPQGALLRFPRHMARNATLEKQPPYEKLGHAFPFFFLIPPMRLDLSSTPSAFQRPWLCFSIRLSSPGLQTGKVERGSGGERRSLSTAHSHTHSCCLGLRVLPTGVWCGHRHLGSLALSKGSSKLWCWHTIACSSKLPLPPALTEEAAFLRAGWNESPTGAGQPGASSVEQASLLSTVFVSRGQSAGIGLEGGVCS